MIKVKDHYFISELGKRANNEDKYGLIEGLIYVVCDGVGGAEKGEIASEIVVNTFIAKYNLLKPPSIDKVIQEAQIQLSKFLSDHPEAEGMATTLTFTHITSEGIEVAWVGDSRVYQFRNGTIKFVTQDHSWVNQALTAGIITAKEAVNHPKSKVITRALQGIHKSVIAERILLTDIQTNDYFLHCSDGVLEAWSDEDLMALFASELSCEQILDRIRKECQIDSKDNFTAIVYQIEEGVSSKKKNIHSSSISFFKFNSASAKPAVWKWLLLGLFIVGLVSFFVNKYKQGDKREEFKNIKTGLKISNN